MADKPFLSILIPTLNEAECIEELIGRIILSLDKAGFTFEIVVIDDDSKDDTASLAQKVLGNKGKVIRRKGLQRSLSLSVLDGIKDSSGEAIVVMDADGSHPPELLPVIARHLGSGQELVIPSRYVPGGGVKDFPVTRQFISRMACKVGGLVTRVKDNTSGFFGIKRSCLDGVILSPRGFKIGLEVFVKARCSRFIEIPFIFENRKKGKSKLKGFTVMQYFLQVLSLVKYKIGRYKR